MCELLLECRCCEIPRCCQIQHIYYWYFRSRPPCQGGKVSFRGAGHDHRQELWWEDCSKYSRPSLSPAEFQRQSVPE